MKLGDYLTSRGVSKAWVAKRLGVSRQAVNSWGDGIPEKWAKMLLEMPEEEPLQEVPDDIWNWSPARIKEEVCVRRCHETDYEIARSLGLRVWEFNRLVDKVRRVGIDIADGKDVERLQVIKNGAVSDKED